MKKILVIGKNKEIANVIIRLLDAHEGYTGLASTSIQEMHTSLMKDQYDLLLIGAGFDKKDEEEIRRKAIEIQPAIKVFEHYGGGSGLLLSELKAAFGDE
ncbi:MAG: hypothetical protein AAGA66_00155 [Bacteroidota bacterium]